MIIESSSNLKLKRSLELYLEDLILQYPDADAVSAHTFSPRFERKMSALISRRKKPYYYLVNTVGKQVAVVILVILLTLSGTVFSVKALREPVVNFFIEIYETFLRYCSAVRMMRTIRKLKLIMHRSIYQKALSWIMKRKQIYTIL